MQPKDRAVTVGRLASRLGSSWRAEVPPDVPPVDGGPAAADHVPAAGPARRAPWRDVLARSGPYLGRLLTLGSVAVVAVLLVQAVVGLGRIGVSNDEPGHVARTTHWLESGWHLPDQFFDDQGGLLDSVPTERRHTYGGAFSLTAHVVATIAGVEDWGAARHTADAYLVRHAVVLALGVAAAAAVGCATIVVTRRRSIAAWSAAAVVAMPLWTGYSLFAVKDVPAGAGWTMVTAGCIVAIAPGARRRSIAAAGWIAVGVWFSFGTRTGLWLPVTGTIVVALVLAGLQTDRARARRAAAVVGLPALASALLVAAVHRHNAATPITWLWSAVARSADFDQSDRLTLTAGHLLGVKPPWWYLPAWLGASVPLLLAALAVLGLTIVVVAWSHAPRSVCAPGSPGQTG